MLPEDGYAAVEAGSVCPVAGRVGRRIYVVHGAAATAALPLAALHVYFAVWFFFLRRACKHVLAGDDSGKMTKDETRASQRDARPSFFC